MSQKDLISDDYLKQCIRLHEEMPTWGNGPAHHLHRILDFLREFKSTEVIDYGCGKGKLSQVDVARNYQNYDPAVARFSKRPEPSTMLVCIDVLEHIEPDSLDAVLEDIAQLTMGRALLIISTVPAKETLPDGRNAHLNQFPYNWWVSKLADTFRVKKMEVDPSFVTLECIPLRLYEN